MQGRRVSKQVVAHMENRSEWHASLVISMSSCSCKLLIVALTTAGLMVSVIS